MLFNMAWDKVRERVVAKPHQTVQADR